MLLLHGNNSSGVLSIPPPCSPLNLRVLKYISCISLVRLNELSSGMISPGSKAMGMRCQIQRRNKGRDLRRGPPHQAASQQKKGTLVDPTRLLLRVVISFQCLKTRVLHLEDVGTGRQKAPYASKVSHCTRGVSRSRYCIDRLEPRGRVATNQLLLDDSRHVQTIHPGPLAHWIAMEDYTLIVHQLALIVVNITEFQHKNTARRIAGLHPAKRSKQAVKAYSRARRSRARLNT